MIKLICKRNKNKLRDCLYINIYINIHIYIYIYCIYNTYIYIYVCVCVCMYVCVCINNQLTKDITEKSVLIVYETKQELKI